MEGKQELDEDVELLRASPLDFPSARAYERIQMLAQERFGFNMSPPTIPRSSTYDTNRIFHTGGSTSTATTTSNTTRSAPFSSSSAGPTRSRGSAFSFSARSQEDLIHGLIPAFDASSDQRYLQHQQQQHQLPLQHQSWEQERSLAPPPQQPFARRESPSSYYPTEDKFFTPLQELNLARSDSAEEDSNFQVCWPVAPQDHAAHRISMSPTRYRPPSATTSIQTMDSIDESVSPSVSFDSSRERAFQQSRRGTGTRGRSLLVRTSYGT